MSRFATTQRDENYIATENELNIHVTDASMQNV
jgi:hypothetical protein